MQIAESDTTCLLLIYRLFGTIKSPIHTSFSTRDSIEARSKVRLWCDNDSSITVTSWSYKLFPINCTAVTQVEESCCWFNEQIQLMVKHNISVAYICSTFDNYQRAKEIRIHFKWHVEPDRLAWSSEKIQSDAGVKLATRLITLSFGEN